MILGKLELTEQTDMAFSLEVFGTTEQTQYARLVIEGPDFDVACKCKIENGEVIAAVPKLKGILPSGVYESRLEVVVGDKIFCPLKEQIELNPLIEFDVKKKGISPVKEGVKVTVKNKMTSEDTRKTPTQNAIDEGYEVVSMNNFNVLKKDGKYCGLVSESKIMKSKTPFDTIAELVEELSK
jgi:hypothetical protein